MNLCFGTITSARNHLHHLALQGDDQAVADELLVVALVGLVHLLGGVRGGQDGEGEVRCLASQEWRWDFFSG